MQALQQLITMLSRAFQWWVIVTPWEQAMRVRFGRWVKMLGAGPHLVIPFVDQVYKQSVRRRLKLVSSQVVTSQDGVAITVAGAIGYSIVDLRKLYDTLHDADDTIECEAAGVVADFISRTPAELCKPEAIEAYVAATLKLDEYGLGQQEFFITNFVAARVYRIISGEIKQWQQGGALDTIRKDGQP